MERRIKERYSDNILQEATRRFGIADGQIRLLDGFESFMYEFEKNESSYILRIGHSLRRNVALIQAEVDWINYLAAGGATVARAVLSERGNLVEGVDDGQGEQFLATAFIKASGGPPAQDVWNARLFERYGQLIGRMHALSKSYEPPRPEWRRPHWNDAEMLEVDRLLPPSEWRVLERYHELMERLATLPRDRETYGLIHQDAHGGNFFVDDVGNITLFDFDDCAYSWYANDIAIVLFYAVMYPKSADDIREFMIPFLKGYHTENRLDPAWLQEIPYFLKLREIDMYAVIHRSFDVNNLDDPWVARFMAGRKERLEAGTPYHDYDFTELARRNFDE